MTDTKDDVVAEEAQQDENIDNTPEDQEKEPQQEALKEQLLRSLADLENAKKQHARALEDAHKYSVTGFARDLLTVVDALTLALSSVPADKRDSFYEGIELTKDEFYKVMKKHHITEISPEQGARFDHNYHQAVVEVEKEDVMPGCIVDMLQCGYSIHDRLLRPAMVSVSKKSADKSEDKDKN